MQRYGAIFIKILFLGSIGKNFSKVLLVKYQKPSDI